MLWTCCAWDGLCSIQNFFWNCFFKVRQIVCICRLLGLLLSFYSKFLRDICTLFCMILLSTRLDCTGSFPIPSSDCVEVTWSLCSSLFYYRASAHHPSPCSHSSDVLFQIPGASGKFWILLTCTCIHVYAHTHPCPHRHATHSHMHNWTASFASVNHFGHMA